MKLIIAKTAGFCMGVRRAVELVLDAPGSHQKPIYTYGPLIHNPQVLDLLADKGISALDDAPDTGEGTILIRAHGIPPQTKDKLKGAGFDVIDATCPRVIKVQSIIRKHAAQGYASIIVGDWDHPEVIGLLGYAGKNGHVIGTLEELKALPTFDRAILVAQTTQNARLFSELQAWVQERRRHYKVFDTICDSTNKRQAEIQDLAGCVDVVVVVGGKSSGNTQRLAEIARRTGKPTFHIESEEDLDFQALATARSIGITAGASTPNWVIKRVFRTLEALPYRSGRIWRRMIYAVERFLLLTNLYVSLGAGCLCYACARLLQIGNSLPYVLIAVLYVQSMHLLNHLTGSRADRYNDPERGAFYRKYRYPLSLLAVAAGGGGLITAFGVGWVPFLLLLVMSLLGLSYNLQIVPKGLGRGKYRRIRDIPSSKTVLIAMAWGVVTAVLPFLAQTGTATPGMILVFLFSVGMVFTRTAFFDILDMQGDRVVGRETIPIIIGEKRAMRILKYILAGTAGLLFAATAAGLVSSLGYALMVCPAFLAMVIAAYRRRRMLPGGRLEFLVESHFVLTGVVAFFWQAF
jgi:(E)-4-hydroxy-3-methyl-but-2-enyl pyrophosphate reductase